MQIKNKISKGKCKIEPLEVSGHWFRILRQTNSRDLNVQIGLIRQKALKT